MATPIGAPRRVWRAAPATLALVVVFCVAAGVCVPVLAYLVLLREQNPTVPIFLGILAGLALVYGWRLGLHPRLEADPTGVTVHNPGRRSRFAWSEISVLAPGENGLVVGSEQESAAAWCVQKSRWSTRRGRRTRSDRIADELFALQEQYDPPLEDVETGVRIRRARWHEHGLLTRLERSASKAALGHIFPPDVYPYPTGTGPATLASPAAGRSGSGADPRPLREPHRLRGVREHRPAPAPGDRPAAGPAGLRCPAPGVRDARKSSTAGRRRPSCGCWSRTRPPARSTEVRAGRTPISDATPTTRRIPRELKMFRPSPTPPRRSA